MAKELTCKERWLSHKDSRVADIRRMWDVRQNPEASEDDLDELYDYGLSFDYVAPETFDDQLEGYWRWQISWGGPSDEFRFYASSPHCKAYRISYCFMDWFDGHDEALTGADRELLAELWEWFQECGTAEHVYGQALEAA